jgi:hypothetical protein
MAFFTNRAYREKPFESLRSRAVRSAGKMLERGLRKERIQIQIRESLSP